MGHYGAILNVQEGLGFPLVIVGTHLPVMAARTTSRLKESSFCLVCGTEGSVTRMRIPLTAHSYTWNC